MGCKRKISRIGNSYGIIIPKPILEEHNLKIGDSLELISNEGIFALIKVDGKHGKNRKNK